MCDPNRIETSQHKWQKQFLIDITNDVETLKWQLCWQSTHHGDDVVIALVPVVDADDEGLRCDADFSLNDVRHLRGDVRELVRDVSTWNKTILFLTPCMSLTWHISNHILIADVYTILLTGFSILFNEKSSGIIIRFGSTLLRQLYLQNISQLQFLYYQSYIFAKPRKHFCLPERLMGNTWYCL
jgi:hypothetical protein